MVWYFFDQPFRFFHFNQIEVLKDKCYLRQRPANIEKTQRVWNNAKPIRSGGTHHCGDVMQVAHGNEMTTDTMWAVIDTIKSKHEQQPECVSTHLPHGLKTWSAWRIEEPCFQIREQ